MKYITSVFMYGEYKIEYTYRSVEVIRNWLLSTKGTETCKDQIYHYTLTYNLAII